MTLLTYSEIPKGLLPLTHKAINYSFVSKNRSSVKNSTETIWENLQSSYSGKHPASKVILSKQKCHPWAARPQLGLLLFLNSTPILHSYTIHYHPNFYSYHTHTLPTSLLWILELITEENDFHKQLGKHNHIIKSLSFFGRILYICTCFVF